MADLASDPGSKGGDFPNDAGLASHQESTASTPRWAKMFGTFMVALVLLFVALHLTGHGFGGHTTLPSAAQHP